MKKSILITLCVSSALSLSACSTNGSMGGRGMGAQGDSLTANGIAGRSGLNGQDYGMNTAKNRSYYFDFDKNVISKSDYPSIDSQGNYVAKHQESKVLVAGNTDARGSREYNIALGERRAKAVANRLSSQGVNPDQLNVVSYGAEKPVAKGTTETEYAQNRRVDLNYLQK